MGELSYLILETGIVCPQLLDGHFLLIEEGVHACAELGRAFLVVRGVGHQQGLGVEGSQGFRTGLMLRDQAG